MRLFVFLFLLFAAGTATGQTAPSWTWMHGDGNFNPTPAHYGTRGVASPANKPPHRAYNCTWTDKQGNLWMFGGREWLNSNYYNDLWKYNPASNTWTWMHGDTVINKRGVFGVKGVSSPLNTPGARSESCCWSDSAGNLWLYGGHFIYGSDSTGGVGADLWKYTVATNEWTWVGGSNSFEGTPPVYGFQHLPGAATHPGAAYSTAFWTGKDGRFWMYGGFQVTGVTVSNYGWNNLVWSYDPGTGRWTWEAGSNGPTSSFVLPVSQVDGQFSQANRPGGLVEAATCVDSSGRFWLYGGWRSTGNYSNILWCFDPAIRQWALIRGRIPPQASVFDMWPGVYGQRNVEDTANLPGNRTGAHLWYAGDDNIWMFGGLGVGATSPMPNPDGLNDLWKFNISSRKWTWVKGDSTISSMGHYGIKGVADTLNNPPSRDHSAHWVDTTGNFWIFGNGPYHTDMWRLDAAWIGKQTELDLWGQFEGDNIRVEWKTTREVGTHHFILEKGASRTAFAPIDSVGAAGYSSTPRTYGHLDMHPFADTNFYRVRIVNTSGAVSYSRIIALKKAGGAPVDPQPGGTGGGLYPNPVRDVVQVPLSGASGWTTIALFDITGRLLYTEQVYVNAPFVHSVNVWKFPPGTYLLGVENAQERRYFKLLKL